MHTGAVTERVLGATAGSPGWPCGTPSRSTLDRSWSSPPASGPATRWPARPASTLAERGGVLVDEQCRTSDPHVWAIGECAAPAGRMYGLVAPGYAMAEVVVDALLGGPGTFTGADMSTKLKLLGVDVASFGDAFATTEGALELVFADAVAGVYKKLVVSEDGTRLLGGILVGDASAYGVLRPMVAVGHRAAGQPGGADPPAGPRRRRDRRCPTRPQVCSCNDVTKAEIVDAVAEGGSCDSASCVTACTRAGTTCGSCKPVVKKIVEDYFESVGRVVDRSLCEHFPLTRQELFDVVAVHGYTRSTRSSTGTAPAAAATSASRRSPRSWPRCSTATCSRADPRPSRTPTTPTSPTSSATAPTRSSRGSPAARSPPRS